jgi:hypothetical protein
MKYENMTSNAEVMRMLELIDSFRVSRALNVISTLGVVDYLQAGPRTSEDLAREAASNLSGLEHHIGPWWARWAMHPLGTFRCTVSAQLW